ncbi:protein PLANT CADMIUM RESISTANCE 2-like [Lotus japonicus]|uniref:protein PLANT CADMIUM RESISTANCE 2-like n=1 Tax=Lotus japonicus TaxID=34305 RepID=UPI00258390BF|nr:protein PLANT CADMIUM RESISTANCE 2-like [Lotus japonicus]
MNKTLAGSSDYQPIPPPRPQPPVEWSTGLCDCFSDYDNCCLTCWCPWVTFGRTAEILEKGSISCGYSGLNHFVYGRLYSVYYRRKMRSQYNLKGNNCLDCLTHFFCNRCALCQEYRELEKHGFNMKIGWHGNVEQQTRGVAMTSTAPTVEKGMTR